MRTILVENAPLVAPQREALERVSSRFGVVDDSGEALRACREAGVDLIVHAGSTDRLDELCGPLREMPACQLVGLLAVVPPGDVERLLEVRLLDPCDFVRLDVPAEELAVRACLLVRQARELAEDPSRLHRTTGASQMLAEVEELVGLGCWQWLPESNEVHWSKQLYRIFDLAPESFPATLDGYLSRVHPADRNRTRETILHTLESGEPFDHHERILLDDGQVRWLRSRGLAERGPDGRTRRLFGTCQDVTAQRTLEQQLIQSQKMEALGRLAGGVAHDFNNLLSVVLTFAGMISTRSDLPEEPRQWSTEILKAADKAAKLTRRLLDFSRRRAVSLQEVDVDAVCRAMHTMLHRLLADDVELTLELDSEPWSALADAGQLEQVIVNLAVNARDAMRHGGTLRIVTERRGPDEPPPEKAGLPAGEWIHLLVADDGRGMDEETLASVFDPFFTTKERGEGTGLGLAIVHGFAQSHGGAVYAESEPGHGTEVHLWLPRTAGRRAVSSPEKPRGSFACPTAGTVLVVEDDEQVRHTLAAILESAGCQVVSASGMEPALDILRARKADIAILITDVIMPRGGGRELAERAHQLHPDLPVLFVSGHPDDDLIVRNQLGRNVPFLQKPFTAEMLLEEMTALLGSLPPGVTRG